jgi:hypothetical protein
LRCRLFRVSSSMFRLAAGIPAFVATRYADRLPVDDAVSNTKLTP